MKKINLLTLFSGVGSPEAGALRVYDKVNNVAACEWDKFARESYNANYEINQEHYHNDICDMDGKQYKGKVDVVFAGSPCQDFSLAGLRAGVGGNKGILIYEYIRIIEEIQPPIFIYENVKGMLSDKGGRTIKEFVQAFRDMGYHCHYEVLNTKDYNVPQNRERVFLVGFKDVEHYYNFSFAPKIKLEKRLKDILEDDVEEKYYLSDKMIEGFVKSPGDEKLGPGDEKLGYINQNTQGSQVISSDGLSNTLCAGTHGYAQGYIKEGGNRQPKIYQKGRGFNKGGLKEICPTITINSWQENNSLIEPIPLQLGNSKSRGEHIGKSGDSAFCLRGRQCNGIIENNYRIRKLTPRECFRLQDFDDTFKFVVSNSQLYKQAGNSISVNISEMIFRQIELSKDKNTDKESLF